MSDSREGPPRPPMYGFSSLTAVSFDSGTGSSSSSGTVAGALPTVASGSAGLGSAAEAASIASWASANLSTAGGGGGDQHGSLTGSPAMQLPRASWSSSMKDFFSPNTFGSTLIEPKDTRRLNCRFNGAGLLPLGFRAPASALGAVMLFARWIFWIFAAASTFDASSKRAFLPRATAAILAAASSSWDVCFFTNGADGYDLASASFLFDLKLNSPMGG
mmetsp:Transcript_45900/g.120354  ORF Transcript_45900/g.120354 Transcript_45900/m.120354 type:complete len:218 (+) Transcript_45900:665-1318(+)